MDGRHLYPVTKTASTHGVVPNRKHHLDVESLRPLLTCEVEGRVGSASRELAALLGLSCRRPRFLLAVFLALVLFLETVA